jgi:hypothetical protein
MNELNLGPSMGIQKLVKLSFEFDDIFVIFERGEIPSII